MDPIEHDASELADPQSLNLYAYCGNDPLNHTDPDGLDGGASAIIVVIQVVAAVLGALHLLFGGGGGNRARTGPLVKQVDFRETGQFSSQSIWTPATVEAGVGGVAAHVNEKKKKKKKTVPTRYPPVIITNPDGTKSKPPKETLEGSSKRVGQAPPLEQERPLPPSTVRKPEAITMPKDATTRQKLRFWTTKALSGLKALRKLGDIFDGFGKWDVPTIDPQALCEAAKAEGMLKGLPWCPGPRT